MADPLASLHEIRLPELDGSAALASGLAALALGLALALVLGAMVRLVTRQRLRRGAAVLAALEDARRLPPRDRFPALMRFLAELAGHGPESWPQRLAERFGRSRVPVAELEEFRTRLYRGGEPPDLTSLEVLADRLARRVRG